MVWGFATYFSSGGVCHFGDEGCGYTYLGGKCVRIFFFLSGVYYYLFLFRT
jgi:hypothetical protein